MFERALKRGTKGSNGRRERIADPAGRGARPSGQGIGRRLYGALLDAIQSEESIHRAYGGIALTNQSSVALHERLGFGFIGTFREVGFKFGKYWDVSWYEKDVSHAAERQVCKP